MNQTSIFDCLYPSYCIKKPIRLIELFAGIGSQAMALRDLEANFEHYRVVEIDLFAIKSYNAIHGTSFEPSDITQLHGNDLGIFDKKQYEYIMTYSFPCQDLSKAGKQAGMSKDSGTRSGLLWEVERILKELNETDSLPQVLLMENVPDVIGSKNIRDFNEWYAFLESVGYQSYYKILNAKNYGIPQNRNRCFMVSILGEYSYTFPKPIPLEKRLCAVLEENVDEKYYLSDRKVQEFCKANKDISNCIRTSGRGSLDKHTWDLIVQPIPDSLEPVCLNSKVDGKQPSTQDRIYDAAAISMAVTKSYMPNIYNQRIRKLTPLECWRLMGFSDDDFRKAQAVNSNTQLYKQAGNSIVKQVLMAIFKEMIR